MTLTNLPPVRIRRRKSRYIVQIQKRLLGMPYWVPLVTYDGLLDRPYTFTAQYSAVQATAALIKQQLAKSCELKR